MGISIYIYIHVCAHTSWVQGSIILIWFSRDLLRFSLPWRIMAGHCGATKWFEKIFALFVITIDCRQSKKLKAHVSFSGTPRMEIKRGCGGISAEANLNALKFEAASKKIASAGNQNNAKTYEPISPLFVAWQKLVWRE